MKARPCRPEVTVGISWRDWGGVDKYVKNYKVRVKEPEYRNCRNQRGKEKGRYEKCPGSKIKDRIPHNRAPFSKGKGR